MKYFYLPLLTVFLAILISLPGCSPAVHNQGAPSFLVIKNINLVDVEAGIVLPSQDVVVKDQTIVFVGDSAAGYASSNTVYVDGKSKYLMPGLWDMHFHLCWQMNNDSLLFPVLLQNGITGIRDMGGDLAIAKTFKDRIKKGVIAGPEIYAAGPMIDGNPPVQPDFSLAVDDNTNMKKVLDSLKMGGSEFFKTYSLIREKPLREIANYCLANKMSFAGHLSEYVEPEVALSLGQKSVEHLNRLDEIWQGNKPRMDSIGRMMVRQQTFLCPTLITYQLKTRLRDSSVIKSGYDRYIPPSLKKEWKMLWTSRIERTSKNADWDHLNQVYASQKQLINHLNKMGVMVLAGSDFAGMPYVYPGIALHEELILLAECGLTNAQVLRTATINPAIFISKQQLYGSIAIGKYADLLILNKNPLEDIRNVETIQSVILKGKIVK